MKKLTVCYYSIWLSVALVVAVFMLFLPYQGMLATDPLAQYICSVICVVLTLSGIYLALKMMALKRISEAVFQNGFPAYFRYAIHRMNILHTVLIADFLFYHFTLQSSCGFCWLITLFALCFVKPGKKELEHLTNR